MDSALAWIGWIAEWIGKFIPRVLILDTTEGAVKYVKGRKAIPLGPGFHWYWPFTTKISEYPTAFQADRLPTQTMVTKDDRVVIVGGMISYHVADILPLVSGTHQAVTTITNIAMTAVHDVCCKMQWADLMDEQRRGTLDTKLRHAAQRELKTYGVVVDSLVLIDLAPARVLKLLQSTSREDTE